jgi:hypothetical protein
MQQLPSFVNSRGCAGFFLRYVDREKYFEN